MGSECHRLSNTRYSAKESLREMEICSKATVHNCTSRHLLFAYNFSVDGPIFTIFGMKIDIEN